VGQLSISQTAIHLHSRSKAISLHVSSFKFEADTAAEESVQALTQYPTHATLKELHLGAVDANSALKALLCSETAQFRLSSVVKICFKVCYVECSWKKHKWFGCKKQFYVSMTFFIWPMLSLNLLRPSNLSQASRQPEWCRVESCHGMCVYVCVCVCARVCVRMCVRVCVRTFLEWNTILPRWQGMSTSMCAMLTCLMHSVTLSSACPCWTGCLHFRVTGLQGKQPLWSRFAPSFSKAARFFGKRGCVWPLHNRNSNFLNICALQVQLSSLSLHKCSFQGVSDAEALACLRKF